MAPRESGEGISSEEGEPLLNNDSTEQGGSGRSTTVQLPVGEHQGSGQGLRQVVHNETNRVHR